MRERRAESGFTLIELMVVIVIIGILVAIALPNFIGAQERSRIASVKSNMHTVQTMVETYAVDWGGLYPNQYGDLQVETVGRQFAKEFINPISGNLVSLQQDVNCRRLAEFITDTQDPSSYGTTILYPGPGGEACAGQVVLRSDTLSSYGIYGLDQRGYYIISGSRVFELSNS